MYNLLWRLVFVSAAARQRQDVEHLLVRRVEPVARKDCGTFVPTPFSSLGLWWMSAKIVIGLVTVTVVDSFCGLLVVAAVTILGKVNVRNRHRETPLLLAVRADAIDVVSVLLGFGARLDDPDVNGKAAFPLLAGYYLAALV